jgi:hypothetical protein
MTDKKHYFISFLELLLTLTLTSPTRGEEYYAPCPLWIPIFIGMTTKESSFHFSPVFAHFSIHLERYIQLDGGVHNVRHELAY